MTPHLTEAQFADAVIAPQCYGADSAPGQHLASCADCRDHIAALGQPIALFRSAASSFAERELARLPASPSRSSASSALRPAWLAFAAMALLVALLAPAMRQRHSAPAPAAVSAHDQAASDEALLREIDQDIAASVPSPMQPLADPAFSPSNPPPTSAQRTN